MARFTEAMDDDLNTPRALAALFHLARAINHTHDAGGDASDAQATLRELAGVLGFTLHEPPHRDENAAPFVDLLVKLRSELREAKQWALADSVRDGLVDLGVELHDGAEGTDWSFR